MPLYQKLISGLNLAEHNFIFCHLKKCLLESSVVSSLKPLPSGFLHILFTYFIQLFLTSYLWTDS